MGRYEDEGKRQGMNPQQAGDYERAMRRREERLRRETPEESALREAQADRDYLNLRDPLKEGLEERLGRYGRRRG